MSDFARGKPLKIRQSRSSTHVSGNATYRELAANRGKFGYVMFVGFALWEH